MKVSHKDAFGYKIGVEILTRTSILTQYLRGKMLVATVCFPGVSVALKLLVSYYVRVQNIGTLANFGEKGERGVKKGFS